MTAPSLLDELEGVMAARAEWIESHSDTAWNELALLSVNFVSANRAALADMAKRLEAAERDARGEREETWEIWECDMCVAWSDDLGDAQHYLTMYGQDGPVKLVRVISYRETVTPDAIAAATQEGEG